MEERGREAGVADGRCCGFESHDSTKEPEKG